MLHFGEGSCTEFSVGTGVAKVLISQKKFAEVVGLLEPLAKSSSDNADLFESLAQAYAGLGWLKDARRAEARVKALHRPKK